MATPYWKTKDNFEMQIGVNYFAPFLLTNLLLDLLKKTSNSRIINVASVLHQGLVISKFKLFLFMKLFAYFKSVQSNGMILIRRRIITQLWLIVKVNWQWCYLQMN
jgi:NAD(P)-dependent dehydrogenase (short-subunit alcohol dehydrogenase family)